MSKCILYWWKWLFYANYLSKTDITNITEDSLDDILTLFVQFIKKFYKVINSFNVLLSVICEKSNLRISFGLYSNL